MITLIDLFCGAGGLSLGFENAGIQHVLLNDNNYDACATLKKNRPKWNILKGDIAKINFSSFRDVDVVSGGIPCQPFSYAGERRGFDDYRGNIFFEFLRALNEIRPKLFIIENVKGLISHNNGDTFNKIVFALNSINYNKITFKILNAVYYKVPQKRERLFIVGIRSDIKLNYEYPQPYKEIYNIKDALKKSSLFGTDVPFSKGQSYSKRKKEVLSLVPPGGCWKSLPIGLQQEYMGKSFYLPGGKTGMARRMKWDEPSLTLTCSPAQKQTERCHPCETRPFTIREYARIQTFPDDWEFCGSIASQYKQIGNAVPVNLAFEIGKSIIKCFD